jgi:hypothetical protein
MNDAEQLRKHQAMKVANAFLADLIEMNLVAVVVIYYREENGKGGHDVYAQVLGNIPAIETGIVLSEGLEAVRRPLEETFTPKEGLRPERN